MKSVFLIHSSMMGVVGASNTEPKAMALAKHFAEFECWNCDTEIAYHLDSRSFTLGNGEKIDVIKVNLFTSAGQFAKIYPVPPKTKGGVHFPPFKAPQKREQM